FRSGPQEGTVTLEGSLDPAARGKQVFYTDYHPMLRGLQGPWLHPTGAEGSLTLPVRTPGDMVRLRFGGHYRARDPADGWDLQVAFDGAKSFQPAGRLEGPTPGHSQYLTMTGIPEGTRAAQVRWSGSQREATCLFSFRIDADYQEPRGGFAPVR